MRTDRYRPHQPPYLLYGLLVASLGMNVLLVLRDRAPEAPAVAGIPAPDILPTDLVEPELAPSEVDPIAAAPLAPVPGVAPGIAQGEAGAPGALQAAADPAPGEGAAPAGAATVDGWRVLRAEVTHSLARTFQRALPDDAPADAVAAVASRLLVWDLDLRRDLQKGDRIELAWRVGEDGQVEVPVLRYRSGKLGRTLEAYRFQAPGDRWPSWWDATGREVPRRLAAGPLDEYEQVTSLLKDRPSHHGMDFKTPVGTPVKSPKAGTVTRVNWNTRANGKCVEVRYADGTRAIFLHLSEVDARPGQFVAAGTVIGKTGNTGHSTAPHLHYQLERGKRVIDPIAYHGAVRRELPASVRAAFEAERERLADLLAETVASR